MAVLILLGCLSLFYFVGYRGWSQHLYSRVFGIDPGETTPAHNPKLFDNIDYLPVKRHILWGHHYASIAGAAPIIGPAVAVYWGWLPALLWIVFGTLFIGAAHDFGALVLSVRHEGRSMGDVAGEVIHPRVRLLFLLVIYFLNWLVLTVFSFSIAILFDTYPATIIPVNFQIIVAVCIGIIAHKTKLRLLIPSLLALITLYGLIAVGMVFPISLGGITEEPVLLWACLLLAYAMIASALPVWVLLQPRDFINSHQLIVGLTLLILGLLFLNPSMSAPMVNPAPTGAPPLFPLLFVTIACGAISGFHGLVASGTTSKQLDVIADARPIGYGGMLGEGTLAVIATLAVAAGLPNWGGHYHSWDTSGLVAISHFVKGAGAFLDALLIPTAWSQVVIAILVISFAATSMDTAARIQRLVVGELGTAIGLPVLRNRFLATLIAVAPAVPLVLAGKSVWGPLWMLFGTTNQLIGAMTLLVLYVYLHRSRRPSKAYALPMIGLVATTTAAMCYNLATWTLSNGNLWTISIGFLILLLELWMIFEAILILWKENHAA